MNVKIEGKEIEFSKASSEDEIPPKTGFNQEKLAKVETQPLNYGNKVYPETTLLITPKKTPDIDEKRTHEKKYVKTFEEYCYDDISLTNVKETLAEYNQSATDYLQYYINGSGFETPRETQLLVWANGPVASIYFNSDSTSVYFKPINNFSFSIAAADVNIVKYIEYSKDFDAELIEIHSQTSQGLFYSKSQNLLLICNTENFQVENKISCNFDTDPKKILWSPNEEQYLAVFGGNIALYSVTDGSKISSLTKKEDGEIQDCLWNRTRNIIFIALENKIMIWGNGPEKTTENEIIDALLTNIICLGCSDDGKYLASVGDDGYLKVWNIDKDLKKIGEKNIQRNKVDTINFSNESKYIFCWSKGADGFVHVINCQSMETKILIDNKREITREIYNVAISPIKNLFVVNLADEYAFNYFILYDTDTGSEIWNTKSYSVYIDKGFLTKDKEKMVLLWESGIKIVNLDGLNRIGEISFESGAPESIVSCCFYNKHSNIIVVSKKNLDVALYEFDMSWQDKKMKLIRSFKHPKNYANRLEIDVKDQYLYTITEEKQLYKWDAESLTPLKHIKLNSTNFSFHFNILNTKMYCEETNFILVFNVADPDDLEKIHEIKNVDMNPIADMCVLPAPRKSICAIDSEGFIAIWNSETYELEDRAKCSNELSDRIIACERNLSVLVQGTQGGNFYIHEHYTDNLALRRTIIMKDSGSLFLSNNENNFILLSNNFLSIFKNSSLNTQKIETEVNTITFSQIIWFSKSGKILGFGNERIILFDLKFNKLFQMTFTDTITSVFLNPQETHFLINHAYKYCSLFNMELNKFSKLWTIKESDKDISISNFSANNPKLIQLIIKDKSSGSEQTKYQEAELSTGKLIGNPVLMNFSLQSDLRFMNDYQSIVLCETIENDEASWEYSVKYLNLATLEEKIIMRYPTQLGFYGFAMNKARTLFAIKQSKKGHFLSVRNFSDSKEIWNFIHDEPKPVNQTEIQNKTEDQANANQAEEYYFINTVLNIVFSPDGKYLADSDLESNILLYDVQVGTLVQKLRGHRDVVIIIDFNEKQRTMVSVCSSNNICLWSLESFTILRRLFGTRNASLWGMCNFNLRNFYVMYENWFIDKWHLQDEKFKYKKEVFSLSRNQEGSFSFIDGSYDEKYLIIKFYEQEKYKIMIYTAHDEKLFDEIQLKEFDSEIVMNRESAAFAYFQKGEKIVNFYDIENKKIIKEYKIEDNSSNSLLIEQFFYMPRNQFLLRLFQSETEVFFHIVDFKNSKCQKKILLPVVGNCQFFIAFTRGLAIPVPDNGNPMKVWEFPSMNLVYQVKLAANESVSSVVFSSDEKLFCLALYGLGAIKIIRSDDGQELTSFPDIFSPNYLQFTPDNKFLYFTTEQIIRRVTLINYDEFIRLRSFHNNLTKIDVPEELVIIYTNNQFKNFMLYDFIYPLHLNIIGYYARISDVNALKKLFKACNLFGIFPQIILDYENKSSIDFAIEKKNISLIDILLSFYLKNPQPLHKCPAITSKTLSSLFDLGMEKAPDILESRFMPVPTVKPLIPIDIGDVFTSSFKIGYLNKEDFLAIYRKKSEESLNQNNERLTTPDIRILDVKGVLLPSNKFLEEVSELEVENPIFQNPALLAILSFKWENYAKRQFLLKGCAQILFLIIYTANTIYIAPCRLVDESNTYSWEAWGTCSRTLFCLDIVILCMIGVIIFNEVTQIYFLSWKRYKRSLWNFIDFVILLFGTGTMVLSLTETLSPLPEYINLLKAFYSISTFFVWVRIIDFLRGFSGTAFLIRILIQVVLDMMNFIIILFLLLVAFALAAYSLQSKYGFSKWESFQAFYRVLLGDFGSMNEMQSDLDLLTWIVFLLMTLLMMIIMLNLLIAIISDTYDKVIGMEKLANAYEKTNIIVDIEKCLPKYKLLSLEQQINNYLVVSYTKPIQLQSEGTLFNDRMRNKVEKIEKKVNLLEEVLEKNFERMGRKDKYLLDYLEKNFNKFNEIVDDCRKKT